MVNEFDWGALLIWFPSWFTSWSFFWTTSLGGTFGGTAGGFAFLDISDRVLSDYLCPFTIVTRGIAGDGFYSV